MLAPIWTPASQLPQKFPVVMCLIAQPKVEEYPYFPPYPLPPKIADLAVPNNHNFISAVTGLQRTDEGKRSCSMKRYRAALCCYPLNKELGFMMLHKKKNGKALPLRFGVPLLATVLTLTGVTSINIAMPAPAFAKSEQDTRELRTQVVRYHDLNLASAEGVSQLQRRINRAAKNVCKLDGVTAVIMYQKVRRCVDAAESAALKQASQKIIQLQQLARK